MAKLSTAAWVAHDLGLATAIGGTVFGKTALQPALHEIGERASERVSDEAWRRFGWINLAAHGVIAASWFVGRAMVSGRSVSRGARRMTTVKDAIVIASVATGVATVVLGRLLSKRIRDQPERDHRALERTVGALGTANLVADLGIGAITTVLAMEGNKSLPFGFVSRRLP